MKNVHVLQTDKTILNNVRYSRNYQNIYITNDEEIKEGDWFINESNQIEKGIEYYDYKVLSPESKKIILTTDLNLIKDGIQAIDDEFLEWFLKNSSCESVKVEKLYNDFSETDIFDLVCTSHSFIYKIIIPKEEPKQYSKFLSCCRSKEECHCKKEEPKLTKEFQECVDFNDKIYDQETLEEAAKRMYGNNEDGYYAQKRAFKIGAEWQQEKMYSERQVFRFLEDALRNYDLRNNRIQLKDWFYQYKKK
jgi:hypothetical protein